MNEVLAVTSGAGTERVFAYDISSEGMRKIKNVGDSAFFTIQTTGSINFEEAVIAWTLPVLLP